MSYEEKDNEGVLFRNDKRETDAHPNAKGSARIDGVDYWVSAWTNTSAKGDKYQKLRYERKDKKAQPQQQPAPPDDDLDVPF